MKVCPEGALQPALAEAGLEGLWTPRLVPRLGYCEYTCNLCGQVCPTEAIEPLTLEQKQQTRIGLASFDITRCIPYAYGRDCMVCEEHCPIPDKAIFVVEVDAPQRDGSTRKIKQPHVDPEKCIGCGICENVCPYKDGPAIRVMQRQRDRATRATTRSCRRMARRTARIDAHSAAHRGPARSTCRTVFSVPRQPGCLLPSCKAVTMVAIRSAPRPSDASIWYGTRFLRRTVRIDRTHKSARLGYLAEKRSDRRTGREEMKMNASLRSQRVLTWPECSVQRALYKSMGYTDYDLDRPLVGIANSWNRVVPGHYNLQLVAEYVKQGVFQAGGTPVEFGVIAACDGIAQGHVGMHYILPTRDLIANDIEMMAEAHQLDGLVLLGSCDKIVPGMLMAAARLDLPAILVVGGPMEGGCEFDGRASDVTSLTEGLGMLKAGKLDEETLRRLEDRVAPTCGSCSFLGTANTMCCVAEAMGMCLPGSATIPATHAARLHAAQASGRQIVELIRQVHHGPADHQPQGGRKCLPRGRGDRRLDEPRAPHPGDRLRGRMRPDHDGRARRAVAQHAAGGQDEPGRGAERARLPRGGRGSRRDARAADAPARRRHDRQRQDRGGERGRRGRLRSADHPAVERPVEQRGRPGRPARQPGPAHRHHQAGGHRAGDATCSAAAPAVSIAKRRPTGRSSTARSAKATWWSSATKGPRAARACARCTRP